MATELARLYSLLAAKPGVPVRTRDVRLEKIAADRALEMRYQQGLDYRDENPLERAHEFDQLRARVFPLHATTTSHVGENLAWHYFPPSWVEHVEAAVDATIPDRLDIPPADRGRKIGWWNSAVHKSQLLDADFTHWGIGVYYQDVPAGARRWYFVTVFAGALQVLVRRRVDFGVGIHTGYHLTALGQEIGRKAVTIGGNGSGADADERHEWPGRGPMYHITNGAFATYWVPESIVSPKCYWKPLA